MHTTQSQLCRQTHRFNICDSDTDDDDEDKNWKRFMFIYSFLVTDSFGLVSFLHLSFCLYVCRSISQFQMIYVMVTAQLLFDSSGVAIVQAILHNDDHISFGKQKRSDRGHRKIIYSITNRLYIYIIFEIVRLFFISLHFLILFFFQTKEMAIWLLFGSYKWRYYYSIEVQLQLLLMPKHS